MVCSLLCGLTEISRKRAIPVLNSIWQMSRRRAAALAGDYRNIMNLCRVLPNGSAAKRAVDTAIDLATPVGVSGARCVHT